MAEIAAAAPAGAPIAPTVAVDVAVDVNVAIGESGESGESGDSVSSVAIEVVEAATAPSAVARLSYAYMRAYYAAYPHRGVWAGWEGCAGLAPDLSLNAVARRIAALDEWEERLNVWRGALVSAHAFAALPMRPSHAQRASDSRQAAPHKAQRLSPAFTPIASSLPSLHLEPRDSLSGELAWASLEIEALRHACLKERFNLRDWTFYSDNPASFFPALDISPYLMRAFSPEADRLLALTAYLRQVPRLIAQIEERLAVSSPRGLAPGARWLYQRLLAYYREQAPALGLALLDSDGDTDGARSRALVTLPRASEASAYQAALENASDALAQFIDWLTTRVAAAETTQADTKATGAMGAATLVRMLSACLSEEGTITELLALGEADLEQNRQRASEIAGRMGLAGRPLPDVFATLDDWPAADSARWTANRIAAIGQSALTTARAAIDELRAFTLDHDLLPAAFAEGDCRVAFQPPYLNSPFALLEGPGPFERGELPAWLYLPRPPSDALTRSSNGAPLGRRTAIELRRAWLSRLTPWTLRNTIAHESFPGHYAFLRALHGSPSLAARAFRNVATFEGWAHYAEELVSEHGFGADDPRNALAMRRAAIFRDCRYLISLRLHTGDLSLDDAASLIVRETGLARTLAESDARRCLADPACVGYTLGKLQLLRLRDDYARQRGSSYTLRGFHEAVLALGQLPLSLIRNALLGD